MKLRTFAMLCQMTGGQLHILLCMLSTFTLCGVCVCVCSVSAFAAESRATMSELEQFVAAASATLVSLAWQMPSKHFVRDVSKTASLNSICLCLLGPISIVA